MQTADTVEVPSITRHEPMMWLNTDRVLYVGLAGVPSARRLGAYSIYLSLNKPHRIRIEGGAWEEAELSAIPPYVAHSIITGERMFCNILVESDSVDAAGLPTFVAHGCGAIHDLVARASLQRVLGAFQRSATRQFTRTADFDRAFFGEVLATRAIDRRIGTVLARIKDDPNSPTSAQDCAEVTHLSVSRFLHLFKAEAGTPFRSFRSWQRARSVLYYVTQDTNLATIALDVGYPDSTHFSHSIRQVFGLTPKSMFAGSRKLALYGRPAAALPRYQIA